MTKLLDQAIAAVRKLSPADQDETAEMLLWMIEARAGSLPLDEETEAAIEEGLAQATARGVRDGCGDRRALEPSRSMIVRYTRRAQYDLTKILK